ncbi:Thiol-disulfide oxidoreductase ResA [compost metagenome]
MKKLVVILWISLIFIGIGWVFWDQEMKYHLPTPTPKHYKSVKIGSKLDLSETLPNQEGKPTFIHFFNPSCPCSRFNVPHVRSLIKAYGNKISFAIVVISNDKEYTTQDIQEKFDTDIPIFFDSDLAKKCGVYSTPQAVIINQNQQLYYRGNYNKSRYCTNKRTNYAQLAIESMLKNDANPLFSTYALKSYGCELPIICGKS